MSKVAKEVAATLEEIARDISTLRSPDLLLTSIARRARRQLETDIAYLSLNSADAEETYIRATDGVKTEEYAAITMPLGTGVLGLAAGGIVTETPDYLPDEGKTHLPEIDRVVQAEGVRAIAGAPLRVAGKVVGALMVANRTPGAFTAQQQDHLTQIASLAAAAVELVTAKQNESAAVRATERATSEHARVVAAEKLRAELETRLSLELAEHRGLNDVVAVAASIGGVDIQVFDASGDRLAASVARDSLDPTRSEAEIHVLPLLGDAGPGTVQIATRTGTAEPRSVAEVVARYASIALLSDRTVDDIEHFHETELVGSLISPTSANVTAPAPAVIHRTIGADGPYSVAVLTPAISDDAHRRRLLSRVHALSRAPRTIVARNLSEIVVLSGAPEQALVAQLRELLDTRDYYGGVTTAHALSDLPAARAAAANIAGAMRALERPGTPASAAEAGVAGLLLSSGDSLTAHRYVAAFLGPLLGARRGEALMTTALVYLDVHGSIPEAGRRLHIHPNTVRQRVERVDTLLGETWRRGPAALDTHLALRVWHLQGK